MASPLLDFSKFKHVKSDEKSTTLQHADGHTVNIVHGVLSKDNQKQLKAMANLPEQKPSFGKVTVKEAEGGEVSGNAKLSESKKTPPDGHPAACPTCGFPSQKMADGGEAAIERDLRSAETPKEDIQENPTPQLTDENTAPAVIKATDFSQQPTLQPAAQPVPPAEEPALEEQSTPQTVPSPAPTQSATRTPEQMGAELKQEDALHDQDYLQGHINPKTYADLFNNKDLPGKVGSIFGMLLSGAGSGLSGQPNALLGMMDKELERDYEAQKTNKSNAQTFWKLGMEQAMNKADIANKVKQGKLTDQQAKLVGIQAAVEGNALGQINHNRAILHTQTELVKKLPVGSKARMDAENILGMMSTAVTDKNANIADMAQAKASFLNNINPSTSTDSAFADKIQRLKLMGMPEVAADMEQHHISGIPEVSGQRSERPIPEEQRTKITAMKTLDDKGKDLLDYVKNHSGTWNPKERSVGAQKIEEMKNFYNDSIKGGALTQGRLSWYDEQFAKHPTDVFAQLLGSTAKLKEMINSNSHRKDIELQSVGFHPKHEGNESAAPAGQYTEGQTGTQKSTGKPIIFTNGAWKYK